MPEADQQQGMSISVTDVLYVLFRHKWKILLFATLGIAAAGHVYITNPTVFRSNAKVMVRYVTERQGVVSMGENERVLSTHGRGESVINAEIEILTSRDLVNQVVDSLGAERILEEPSGENDRLKAASLVMKQLSVSSPRGGNVITASFDHRDPAVAREVLQTLVSTYLDAHVEMHRAQGTFDFLQRQTDQLRANLNEVEAQLNRIRKDAEVTDVEEAKKALAERLAMLEESLLSAQASLAEEKARVAGLSGQSGTNATKDRRKRGNGGNPNLTGNHGHHLFTQLASLRTKETELLSRFTAESSPVQRLKEQIKRVKEKLKEKGLDETNARPSIPLEEGNGTGSGNELIAAQSEVVALRARTNALNAQMNDLRTKMSTLMQVGDQIKQLERKKRVAETNYMFFSTSLEQARVDQALDDAGNIPNISIVQQASVALPAPSEKTKTAGMLAAGGMAAGVGLAFLLDYFLDLSVKRPIEVGKKRGLFLLLSVPHLKPTKRPRRKKRRRKEKLTQGKEGSSVGAHPKRTLWTHGHEMRPYFEALRDRVVMRLEKFNHRPKLVGLTSPTARSGVTTVASGLAACLSETGEGKVLLVDLNNRNGTTHPFFRGKPSTELPDLLTDSKDTALIQENLFAAKAVSSNGNPHPVRMRHFTTDLIPQLRKSDYDYIIFDMPPTSETSISGRLAGYMDSVLIVVESEKTTISAMERSRELVAHNEEDVGVVVNRTKRYIPKWLSDES